MTLGCVYTLEAADFVNPGAFENYSGLSAAEIAERVEQVKQQGVRLERPQTNHWSVRLVVV